MDKEDDEYMQERAFSDDEGNTLDKLFVKTSQKKHGIKPFVSQKTKLKKVRTPGDDLNISQPEEQTSIVGGEINNDVHMTSFDARSGTNFYSRKNQEQNNTSI